MIYSASYHLSNIHVRTQLQSAYFIVIKMLHFKSTFNKISGEGAYRPRPRTPPHAPFLRSGASRPRPRRSAPSAPARPVAVQDDRARPIDLSKNIILLHVFVPARLHFYVSNLTPPQLLFYKSDTGYLSYRLIKLLHIFTC